MQKYMRRQIISNSIDFKEANGAVLENNKRSLFLNKILENNDIPLPEALYKKYAATDPDLRPNIVNHIVEEEMKKYFGKEEVLEGVTYHTLDQSKLTPENIAKFQNSLNEKLEKVNDKLIATGKVIEEVKTKNPDLSDTQIKQFENALSRLDTKNLEQHKDTLVNSINEAGKTKLNILEKFYTMITGKDQEAYLSKKVGRILDKKISNLPSDRSVETKKILNQPTKDFAQTKKIQAALDKGNMINTSSSIEVPSIPNKPTPKKDGISR